MRILVVNAGSSSLKLSVVEAGRARVSRSLPAPRAEIDLAELGATLAEKDFAEIDAVGHRIVHGGSQFRDAVVIDPGVRASLGALVELAPLHQPKSLAALDAVTELLPSSPAVACFDTAFHATLPEAASTYALPQSWNQGWELRRYGFHGLSHAWAARRTAEILDVPQIGLRLVSCHLGAGGSLCAIRDGRSIDTTMGFTPLDGLVMATRSGSVDPGLLLWLLERGDFSASEMTSALEHRSGLLGLTGDSDMRAVLARAEDGDEQARLGLEVYLHRLRGAVAAMAASLGGLDALVFTGGVGEHAPEIRRQTVEGLRFLGAGIDEARNAGSDSDAIVSPDQARVPVVVVSAREDLEITRQVLAVLGGGRQ